MANPMPINGNLQQLPTFPQINLNIIPQGMSITIALGPTTAISQLIDASTMDEVTKAWRDSRKTTHDIIRAVQSSKI
jgi:hypothetical protein